MHLNALGLSSSQRVLHIAPEQCIYTHLATLLPRTHYITADFYPEQYPFAKGIRKIDLCSLGEWDTDFYDFIIHCHVLEHTPCNVAYTLYHLHRMLRETGHHIFSIPFVGACYAEDFGPLTSEERQLHFGQKDHMRRFGAEDCEKHLSCLLRLPPPDQLYTHFSPEDLLHANIPLPHKDKYSSHNVFVLRKGDFLLR